MRTLIELVKSTSVVMENRTVMIDCKDHQAVSARDNVPTLTTTEMQKVKGHDQKLHTFLFHIWIKAQHPI